MTELLETYRRRPIRFIELWEEGDWRIKVYGITLAGGSLNPELLAAAKEAALRWLRQPLAPGRRHYGVGFMGVHEDRGQTSSPSTGGPTTTNSITRFTSRPPTIPAACNT